MANYTWVLESPIYLVEGASPIFSITISSSATTVLPALTNASVKVYRNKTDVTATCIPTGTAVISGNVVVLPQITALVGGNIYVVALTVTIDNSPDVKKIELIVSRAGDEM